MHAPRSGLFSAQLSILLLAYIAGLFDSNGCISASCTAAGYFSADVMFGQSNLVCLFATTQTFASLGLSIRF